ncbi:3-sulfinopropanoyl-CoA desulfinase [Rhizobacter sp. Root404]|uniref:3-sulfinopropanoyl-CoA desulfinase n=1 Tax=Rhizobacter sp. Root404 TaxID=1736528 RepID=UPI0006F7C39C|nr:3-sulfinopropanoyl-CoA desulfinase [Rhizobacter sp. Root404]KQW39120.1 acyl-CoA dehydrogenase [Rhizobacter sp. Root404]
MTLTRSQIALQARARDLAVESMRPLAAEVDRTETYPWHTVNALRANGFMGMTMPVEYGGQGASYFDAVLAIEEFSKVCAASGRIMVECNMGAIGAIMKYGSEVQKRLAAGLVLDGDKPAICITEPEAGSAATDMQTTAVRHGDTYVINGVKHWITGAGVSRLHFIFARVMDGGVDRGIAGFIVVGPNVPGMTIRRLYAMGIRGVPEGHVTFENVEVPATMMVCPPGGADRGFAGLMNAYNAQRVGAATVALGIAQGAFELAIDYAKARRQFGRPIAEFQGIQWMLADMSIQLEASRAMIWRAAVSGTEFPDMQAAAQAKVLASDTALKVTNDALQVHGSAGYGRDRPLERMVRDARMFTISGGTAQVLRTQVASKLLGQRLPQTRDGYLQHPMGG